ncbi:hypothetical protein WA026_015919 [Henosepilachna vigintioctopunctata]|uniref:Uncharacterized protein n=1 Tax=Henosepilachna vigintioctopunctata TaxID=420089 RepID=A0AAW1U787_9CUCU
MVKQQNQSLLSINMKFFFALFVSALFVATFAEEDAKKVDKRHVVVGVHGFPWPVVDYPFYHHYYHHLLKRDTSAHSIHKREAVEENKPKSQEKRDLVLGYGLILTIAVIHILQDTHTLITITAMDYTCNL